MKTFLMNLIGITIVLIILFAICGFISLLSKLCDLGFGGFIAAMAICVAIIFYIINKSNNG